VQPPVRRRYRILQLLGSGGFANVYRAEMLAQGGFSRPVAIKLLHSEAPRHDDMLKRLRDEARILGRLRHPGAVGGLGIAHLEVGWAAVMEYVEGVDCAHLLTRTRVPVRVALEIVAEVASVLDAAWNQVEPNGRTLGVLHRDIKPHNVLLDPRGGVHVLDFGAARADNVEREALTRSVMLGTRRYLAPERHEGREVPAGDVYSLGVMLFELLTGVPLRFEELPGTGPLGDRLRDQVKVDLVERSLPVAPEHLRDMAQLVGEMTGYHPDFRPTAATVERRCRELADAMAGPSIRLWAGETVPPLVEARGAAFESDQLCGSVLVELAEITDVSGVEPQRAAAPVAEPPPKEEGGAYRVLLAALAGALLGCMGLVGAGAWWWSQLEPEPIPEPIPEPVPEPVPEPDPEPVPVPVPDPPKPDPPKPAPKKKEEAPPPPSFTLSLSGDVPEEVVLDGPSKVTVRSGMKLPRAGSYSVYVRYPGDSSLKKAGSVAVPDDRDATLKCVKAIPRCIVR